MKRFILSFLVVSFLFAGLYKLGGTSDKIGPRTVGDSVLYTGKCIVFYGAYNKDKKPTLPMSIIFYVLVLILPALARMNKQELQKENTAVYCDKCDQYLGQGNSFDSPCPRCGSNRYRT